MGLVLASLVPLVLFFQFGDHKAASRCNRVMSGLVANMYPVPLVDKLRKDYCTGKLFGYNKVKIHRNIQLASMHTVFSDIDWEAINVQKEAKERSLGTSP